MKTVSLALVVVACGLLAPIIAAQPHRSTPAVRLYADPDFRGECVDIEPGTALADLRDLTFPSGRKVNDRISSIRLDGGAHLVVFADPRYSGDRLELTESVRDLGRIARTQERGATWDNCITSLQVPSRGSGHHRPDPRWHRPPERAGDGGAILYSAPNFTGETLWLEPGTAIGDLRDVTFESGRKINDKVSSIRLEGGVRVWLFADPGYAGDRVELAEDVADLRQLPRISDRRRSWDDCITAIRVSRTDEGPGDGRRLGPRELEALIHRHFRELLRRAPSADEVRTFARAYLDHRWSEHQLRSAIRELEDGPPRRPPRR